MTFCLVLHRNNYWKCPSLYILYPFIFTRGMQFLPDYWMRSGRPFYCYNNKSLVKQIFVWKIRNIYWKINYFTNYNIWTFFLSVMHSFVSSCPRTEDEFFKASTRLGCGNDINGHNQYICIPNEEKTSLVELCYNEVMGVREKGICSETHCVFCYPHISYYFLWLRFP